MFCSRRELELHQTVGIGLKELVAVKAPMLRLSLVLQESGEGKEDGERPRKN